MAKPDQKSVRSKEDIGFTESGSRTSTLTAQVQLYNDHFDGIFILRNNDTVLTLENAKELDTLIDILAEAKLSIAGK